MASNYKSKWQQILAILKGEVPTLGLKQGRVIFEATKQSFGDGVDTTMIPFIVTQTSMALGAEVRVVEEAAATANELAVEMKTVENNHLQFETAAVRAIEELEAQIKAKKQAIEESAKDTKSQVASLTAAKEGVEAVAAFFTSPTADATN